MVPTSSSAEGEKSKLGQPSGRRTEKRGLPAFASPCRKLVADAGEPQVYESEKAVPTGRESAESLMMLITWLCPRAAPAGPEV